MTWPGLQIAGPEKGLIMGPKDFLTRDDVLKAYQRWAKVYDLATYCYYLVGMRIGHWRRLVVEALALRRGDTVIEIGCGTGLNFSLLHKAVGKEGRIIGIDISEAMLAIARKRVASAGWQNVELVCQAAADYHFPEQVDGIFAVGVLNYEPEFDKVVERGTKALAPGRLWAVLDYKMPNNWLRHLAPLFVALGSVYGVSLALMKRHVWESVEKHLKNTQMRELYGGFVYIISGERP